MERVLLSSVHVAHLAVDVLQDLGVGLVLGGVAAQGALQESTSGGQTQMGRIATCSERSVTLILSNMVVSGHQYWLKWMRSGAAL